MRALALPLLLAACGSSGLSPADVESLPAGTASGTAASGDYDLELYVTSCSGSCSVVAGGFTVSLCDVGDLDTASVTVTQTEGALVMDASGLQVDRLRGGLDADGAFEVGAWGTEQGGDVTVIVRSTGVLDAGAITGTAESRGHGSVDGHGFDCTALYDVTGARLE